MNFSSLYNKTVTELNLFLEVDELNPAEVLPVIDSEEIKSTSAPEISQLDAQEEEAQKIIWVEKIIKLLTLLDRKNENVTKLIGKLTEKDTNGTTLTEKEQIIDNLISSLNPTSV